MITLMVDRKQPKDTSSKGSTKSSKDSTKGAIILPPKKSESKIDGVGEFELPKIVSQVYHSHPVVVVGSRNANFYDLRWAFREAKNCNTSFQVGRSSVTILRFSKC